MNQPKKLRKRPVEIEAFEFTGGADNAANISAWADPVILAYNISEDAIYIPTLEGVMKAQRGDWIIRGVKGEYYPCKPDIIRETYDSEDNVSAWSEESVGQAIRGLIAFWVSDPSFPPLEVPQLSALFCKADPRWVTRAILDAVDEHKIAKFDRVFRLVSP